MKTFILLITLTMSSLVLAQEQHYSWFNPVKCTSLELRNYASLEAKSASAMKITDTSFIKEVIKRLHKIPTNGEAMVKFAPTAHRLEMWFDCDGMKTSVMYFNEKIKTPAGGFIIGGNADEAMLFSALHALLGPRIGNSIQKVENLELRYPTFRLIYLGKDVFVVRSNGTDQKLKADLKNHALPFVVDKKKYVLHTQDTPQKDLLDDDEFFVSESK